MNTTPLRMLLAGQCLALAASAVAAEKTRTVLVEAEGFENLGGWVADQQFVDQMGSPILLAHGMGLPVDDAATTVGLPAAGEYRVWVRTRDWVAPWKAPGTPGRFQLLIDGKPLQTTFGTEGEQWHWHHGGTVALPGGEVSLALHDLTGFDGRCDAILFSADQDFTPPNDAAQLAALRREMLGLPETPPDAGRFDLVVVGGGMAGTCAAISAARLGLDVALVQNRPVLGGNNSSEVRVHLGGKINLPPYPAIGGVVRELDSGHHGNAQPAEQYGDDRKLAVAKAEKKLHLFLNMHAYAVERQGHRIVAVLARNIRTNRVLRFPAGLFADCTGDACVGHLAGADYRYGRESRDETGEPLAPEQPDRQTMGTSVMWYTRETDRPAPFPECPWAVQFNEATCQRVTAGNWNWENGFFREQVEEAEYVRDYGLRAVFGNWAFQKNQAKDKQRYEKLKLAWVAYVGGKRESRRLLGDVILCQQDVVEAKPFPDACVTTTWSIDLHYPVKPAGFDEEPFRSRATFLRVKPYPIPYRCLYSRNVENMFMAGRNISVTHVALGTVRVMRTCGMMGEVVGMAAAVCKRRDTGPRGVYEDHLDELKQLMTEGVGKLPVPEAAKPPEPPAWLAAAGPNLARTAAVEVSGNYDQKQYPAAHINDGRVTYTDNRLRWVGAASLPAQVDLTWQKPRTIGAARIVTGWSSSGGLRDPLIDFVVQYHDGSDFKDISATRTTGNTSFDWHVKFPAVTTDRVRLLVTKTPGDLARIWEFELYDLPAR